MSTSKYKVEYNSTRFQVHILILKLAQSSSISRTKQLWGEYINICSDAGISGSLRKRQTNWKGLKEEKENDYRPRGRNLWAKMKRTKYVKSD